jgi:hypothetical protein
LGANHMLRIRLVRAEQGTQPCKIGCKFPQFDDDDGVTRPFEFFVIQNCAAALAKLAAAA